MSSDDAGASNREVARRRIRELIEGSAPGTYTYRELAERIGDLYSSKTAMNIAQEVSREMWRERGSVGGKPVRRSTIEAGERDAMTPAHKRLAVNLDCLLDGTDEAKAALALRARLGSKNLVTRMLAGHVDVTLKQLWDMATALEVPIEQLLGPPKMRESAGAVTRSAKP